MYCFTIIYALIIKSCTFPTPHFVQWPEAEFPRQSLEGCGGCTDFTELDPKLDRAAASAGNWLQARNGMECAAVRILCRQHASIQGELRVNGITANFQTRFGSQITAL